MLEHLLEKFISVSDTKHLLVDLPIVHHTGAQAVIVGIYPSNRIDARITKDWGHYKEGDRLVWSEEHIEIRGQK